MKKDSTSLGYAVFLKPEYNGGYHISPEQQAKVWANTFIVQFLQVMMITMSLYHAVKIRKSEEDGAVFKPTAGVDMMAARFISSMLMHFIVEDDTRQSLNMMKYCLNHRDHFINIYPPYFVAFVVYTVSILLEMNIMLILSTTEDFMWLLLKFVSLTAINRIPGFFFSSIKHHKATGFGDLKLPITAWRKDNPLEGAGLPVYVLRFVYKTLRVFFCSVGFYFFPYIAIFINFKFMI
jgi:hypothetical protein